MVTTLIGCDQISLNNKDDCDHRKPGLYQSVPVYTSQYRSIQVSTGLYQSVPVYTSLYRSMSANKLVNCSVFMKIKSGFAAVGMQNSIQNNGIETQEAQGP